MTRKHQPEAAIVRAATFTFTMEDNGAEPTIQRLQSTGRESVGDGQCSGEGTPLESGLPEVAAKAESPVQDPSLLAEGSPSQQEGTAVVEDKGAVLTSSSNGSGLDADTDETDYTVSLLSSPDLTDAYDNALEALELGNQRERNTFIWIDKCLDRVASASRELREYTTGVLRSSGIGSVDVESTTSKGGSAQSREKYKQRFQAIDEYLLAAYYDISVQENARMVRLQEMTEEAEGSSEGMTASGSKDHMKSMVVNQGYADTCGEKKVKSSEDDGKTMTPEDELEPKLRMLTTASGEGMMTTAKTDGGKTPGGDVLNPEGTQQEVMSEDLTNSRGGEEKGSQTIEGGAEKPSDQTGTISKDNEGDAVEEGHWKQTAASRSSGTENVRRTEGNKQHAGEEACKRAQVIRKLVIRQREALSRLTATAETRVFRINSVCQFLLTCVKCAACVCCSALNAHMLAQLALQVAESSGTAEIVDTVREAAAAASQNADAAVANCEQAIQFHKDAYSVLDEAMAPLITVQGAEFLGEHTVRDVTRAAEDMKQFADGAYVSQDELANKLFLMESMMNTLSNAVKSGKDVNQITKQLTKKFDDAAFQQSVVAALLGTTQFALGVMTAATNALSPLSRLRPGDQTKEPSDQANPPEILSVGHVNIPQDEKDIDQANDP